MYNFRLVGTIYKIDNAKNKMILSVQEYQRDGLLPQKLYPPQYVEINWHREILNPRSETDLFVGDKVKIEFAYWGGSSYEAIFIEWLKNTSWDEAMPLSELLKQFS